MQSGKMSLVLGGLVLFTSGTLLGGYVVWSQQKPGSAMSEALKAGRAAQSTTKSGRIFPPPQYSSEPPVAPVPGNIQSMPIGTKSAPVFTPDDIPSAESRNYEIQVPHSAGTEADESGWRQPGEPLEGRADDPFGTAPSSKAAGP